jgi:TRAP-type C4-dicarboxylate transport system substrate-binding protein
MNGSARKTLTTVTLVLTALTAVGCDAQDRAGGGADDEATVLTFAQPNDQEPPAQLTAWAEQVSELSDGSLEIQFENGYLLGRATYETETLRDVQEGDVDLAWVGARAFDRVGLTSFQALLAPLLVDSHDLQARVFEEGIPAEMLAEVGEGVTGVGVLPGPMRKVLGVTGPFVRPADFHGATVGMQDSGIAETTFSALGAASEALPSGAQDLSSVDAYEQQVASIWGNQYQQKAHHLTGNLNLWPRPLVLVANDEVFDALAPDQQEALLAAGEAAVPEALDAARVEDQEFVKELCDTGLQVDEASAAQLSSFADALEPVYDELRQEPSTAEWLDRITALKAQVAAPPDTMTCTSDGTSSADGPLPDGTYRTTLTVADVAAGCQPGDPGAEPLLGREQVDRVLEFVVDGASINQTEYPVGRPGELEQGWAGSYRVFRDRFELMETGQTEPLTMSWSLEGRRLVLSDMRTDFCDHKTIWTSNPWTLVEPAAEDQTGIEGEWVTRLSASDWEGSDEENGPAGTFTMSLENGILQLGDPSGDVGFYGNYDVFRDRLVVTGGPDPLEASFDLQNGTLRFSDVTVPGCGDTCPYAVVWESHAWTRE